jgi:hypothetical protein
MGITFATLTITILLDHAFHESFASLLCITVCLIVGADVGVCGVTSTSAGSSSGTCVCTATAVFAALAATAGAPLVQHFGATFLVSKKGVRRPDRVRLFHVLERLFAKRFAAKRFGSQLLGHDEGPMRSIQDRLFLLYDESIGLMSDALRVATALEARMLAARRLGTAGHALGTGMLIIVIVIAVSVVARATTSVATATTTITTTTMNAYSCLVASLYLCRCRCFHIRRI